MNYEQRLAAVSVTLRRVLPPDPHMQAVCSMCADHTTAASAFLNVITADAQVMLAQAGDPIPDVQLGKPVDLSLSICQFVVQRDGIFDVPDTTLAPELATCGAVENVGAYLGVPLRLDGQAVGALGVCSVPPHVWTDADREYLALAAGLLSRTIQARADRDA